MKITSIEKIAAARNSSQFVKDTSSEFAFLGRSNVGKSSLLNHLLRHKRIAKISHTPGKTRTIDFYKINKSFFLVDLPGYGYTKIPLSATSSWKKLIETYLEDRPSLKLISLLVDIRHKPTKHDEMMIEWLAFHDKNFLIIATKSDKLSKSKTLECVKKIEKHFELKDKGKVIPFSIKEGAGREKVWNKITAKL